MKIAAKLYLTSLVLCGAVLSWPVVAQVPPSVVEGVVATAGSIDSGAVAPGISSPALGSDKDIGAPSGKVPDAVKNVVKRLNNATEGTTLEDLNAAREAIAKLDVLIDIEKRLNDLSTIRKERDKDSFVPALSASSLGLRNSLPPPLPAATASAAPYVPPAPMVMPAANIEVHRVMGVAGRYMATIKIDGNDKIVREGDKLSDGSVVHSISAQGVTVVKDKTKRTYQVKDIGAIVRDRS